MNHLDLFSGIGGFALAAEEIWPDVEHIFCDNDVFCQNVLRKHWPNAPIYGDIRELSAERLRTDTNADKIRLQQYSLEQNGSRNHDLPAQPQGTDPAFRIDLLTGGFPCQPFSKAGKQRGDKDDRFLWPEMLRVIRETKPSWVIGENVAGIINMALDQVGSALEGEGYAVQ